MTTRPTKAQAAHEQRKAILLAQKERLTAGLPFLHAWPWYKWAREFYESTNRLNFLCAANQISKSSTQIRKATNWATDQALWPRLWRRRPKQFWYLYPSKEVATIEFEKKWTTEFLPAGEFKDDPVYGWRAEYLQKKINAIHFNSGVSIYFKTYAQDADTLQTGTVDAIFCDEELPFHLYDELKFRLTATDGYFHMVFTATLGQEEWRRTIEERGTRDEMFPDAYKSQVSMYDCLVYEDGAAGPWTVEKIKRVEADCSTHNEVLRRVHGRFVVSSGLKYASFDHTVNMVPPRHIPSDWLYYSGVDVGSGGETGHPAAIVFVAVSPDFRKGSAFLGWRGDGVQTTAGDVYEKFVSMRGELSMTAQFYDWHAKDFFTIASRANDSMVPAEKGHDIGEQILNTLFKTRCLEIFDTDELRKLRLELSGLLNTTAKTIAKDDFIDALRYAVTKIPWDFEWMAKLNVIPVGPRPVVAETAAEKNARRLKERREFASSETVEEQSGDYSAEIAEWNEAYG